LIIFKDFNKRSKNICILCRKKYDDEYNKKEETVKRIKTYLKTDTYFNNRYKLNNYMSGEKFFMREEFRMMLSNQNNSCCICEEVFIDDKSAHVDHCHKTNQVRGLLCSKCNHGLGLFKDDVGILKNAINYLGIITDWSFFKENS